MKTTLNLIRSLVCLPIAIGKWIHSTIIAPEGEKATLPPIRYDGDPHDIYLA